MRTGASRRWAAAAITAAAVFGAGCDDGGPVRQVLGEDSILAVTGDVTDLLEERTTGVVEVDGGLSRSRSDRGENVFDVVLCDRVGPRPDVPDVPPLQCLGAHVPVQDEVADLPLDWQSFGAETVVDEILTVRGRLDGEVFVIEEVDAGDETLQLP